MAFVQSELSS